MRRVTALAAFLIGDLFTTLLAVLPVGLAVALYWVTFYYPVTPEYLASVGGWDLAVVCLVLCLLVSDRANRASMYLLVARLPRRFEFVAGIVVAVLVIMAVVAAGFAGLALATGRVALTATQGAFAVLRWAAMLLLASSVGLHLGRLVSRNGSHILAALLLAALFTAGSWRGLGGWATEAVAGALLGIAAPVGSMLGGLADGLDWQSTGIVVGYAAVLLGLAGLLFRGKDLLWPE